jgi:hypothetical protein
VNLSIENVFIDEIELKHKRESGTVKEMLKQLKVNKRLCRICKEKSYSEYFYVVIDIEENFFRFSELCQLSSTTSLQQPSIAGISSKNIEIEFMFEFILSISSRSNICLAWLQREKSKKKKYS